MRVFTFSVLAGVVILSIGQVIAAEQNPVDELARRSGLPQAELGEILSNCDANQSNMYFCAWRDLIVAEQDLQRVANERSATSPACKKIIDRRLQRWPEKRDNSCKKSAAEEYGGGSMEQTAQAICSTSATKEMMKKINAIQCSG